MNAKTQNEKTTAHAIATYSVAPDSRRLVAAAPFRVIAGRGIVDACGRLIATAHARRMLDGSGYVVDAYENEQLAEHHPRALSPCDADGNAHAIAAALNAAHALQEVNPRTVSFIANLSAAIATVKPSP